MRTVGIISLNPTLQSKEIKHLAFIIQIKSRLRVPTIKQFHIKSKTDEKTGDALSGEFEKRC